MTRVGSDGNGKRSAGREGEHQVQEVQGGKDGWPCEELNEEGKHSVEGGEHEAKHRGKEGEVHSCIGMVLGGNERAGQAKDDDEEGKVHGSDDGVGEFQGHCTGGFVWICWCV